VARLKTNNSLVGTSVVDVCEYDREIDDYLRSRGAIDFEGTNRDKLVFNAIHFPGCKPVHHNAAQRPGRPGSARIFFPNDDEALLFVFIAGHKITGSYVKEINSILEES